MPTRVKILLLAVAIILVATAMVLPERTEAKRVESLVLTDIDGAQISVKDEVAKHPVMLVFYREYE